MTRTLIVSDVHANLVALEAVLRDAERGGPIDGVWSLGVRLKTAGAQTVTITDTVTPSHLGTITILVDPGHLVHYALAITVMALARCTYAIYRTRRLSFLLFVLYGFVHAALLVPLRMRALTTLTDNSWGTRTAVQRTTV